MANNRSGEGPVDLNANPNALGSIHVKSVKEAAALSQYLPIRWDELPKLPFYSRLVGYDDSWYRATIAMSVIGMRSRAQRMLSQEEVQILANMTAGLTTTMSYEFPVMLGTSIFLERRTRPTFGFPFYKPKEGFDPNVFPTKTSRLIEGPMARTAWHVFRFSMYAAASHFVLRTAFFAYGTVANSYVFDRDPRLADLRTSLKSALAAKRGPDSILKVTERAASRTAEAREALERRGRDREAQQRGVLPDQEQQQHQQQQQQQQYQPYQQYQSPPQQQQQKQPQTQSYDDYSTDLDDDFYDDASPVSPAEQRRRSGWKQQPTSGTGEGTAWDRLRSPGHAGEKPTAISQAPPGQYGWEALRKGKSPPQPPSKQDNSNRPTTGDYTFNEDEEEKSYARNQAQKDFDAMLEKERQGESDRPSRRW
ncbi:hypothetical protein HMPREF1624_06041 [Sporothrix schenckii ATCC 58251]|uniref:Uncharacterized protein n=1 Tax=Sporothrix schenckii (strain ATCC 58251 / de Perez 2211183) TaxID=1391915 RepID=U7PTU0_SPOS1|nr:hypothetical protein HMPREF1624_06041 [Sporothrix schenckii ATCC 58251]